MAKTKKLVSAKNIQATVEAAVSVVGAKKADDELKGIRLKVSKFKKQLEDNGLDKLNLKGGGLMTPFTNGVKAAIKEQDRLAKGAAVRKAALASASPVAPKVPTVTLGETSRHLASLDKALDKISLKIGQALLPAVDSIVVALVPLATKVGQFVANNPALVQALAAGALAFTVITAAAIGLATVMGVLTSPIGLIAAAVAGAVVIIVLAWKPITRLWHGFMRLMDTVVFATVDAVQAIPAALSAAWNGMTRYLSDTWDALSADAGKFWEGLKSTFKNAWESIKGFFQKMGRDISQSVGQFWTDLKDAFTQWSPMDDLEKGWGLVTTYFQNLWNDIVSGVDQFWTGLKAQFTWSPMPALQQAWDQVSGFFGVLANELGTLAAPLGDVLKAVFAWSPLEVITSNWQPIVEWFTTLWGKLKSVIGPIKELIGSAVGTVTAFFGGNDAPAVRPTPAFAVQSSNSPLLSGGLTQNSNLLVQQTAANNRTQLEGGLTVRFDNAPQGLRVDQPQSNQPGLSLTSRVGYRSLSFGGAYGEQLA